MTEKIYSYGNYTPPKCSNILTKNITSPIDVQGDWGGVPQTFFINLIVCTVLIIIFFILHNNAWSRASRLLTNTHKGWLQFIYGDRSAYNVNIKLYKPDADNHNHDLVTPVILPPPISAPSKTRLSVQNLLSDQEDDDEKFEDVIVNVKSSEDENSKTSFFDEEELTESWEINVDSVDCKALGNNERSKRKAEFRAAKTFLKRSDSTESISRLEMSFFDVLFIKDDDILQHKGADALQYLIFQRYIIYFMFLLTCLCMTIILPINANGDFYDDNKPFGKTTIANVTNSSFLWAHALLAALILPIGIYMMHHFSKTIKADEEQTARKTLFIQGIKSENRDKVKLANFFTKNFPDVVIQGIQFVYDVRDLVVLEREYKSSSSAKMFCHDYFNEYNKRYEVRPYCMGQFGGLCCCYICCPKVDGIDCYTVEEKEAELKIKSELAKTISEPFGSVFITFKTEKMAMEIYKYLKEQQLSCVCCCNWCISAGGWFKNMLLKEERDEMNSNRWLINYAPYPDDVNWEDLAVNTNFLWLKKIVVYFLLLLIFFFLSTPSIFLEYIKYLNILKNLKDGLGVEVKESSASSWSTFLTPFFLLLMTVVLPAIIIYVTKLLPYKTISSLNHGIMWKTFFFLLMMILILPSAGYLSIQALIEGILNKNSTKQFDWQCLFPVDSGAFFVNYVIQAAFIGNTLELLRFPELALYLLYMMFSRSSAECENAQQNVTFDFQFGDRYPRFLLVFTMVVTYSLSNPLITPFGLTYMILKYYVDRYNIYFVYQPSKISGRIHSTAVIYIHFSFLLMQFQIFTFLLIRTSYSEVTGFSMIVFLIAILTFSAHYFLHWFRNINHLTYNATSKNIRTSKKQEYCACTYFPPVFHDLMGHRIIKSDYFSIKTDQNNPTTSTQRD